MKPPPATPTPEPEVTLIDTVCPDCREVILGPVVDSVGYIADVECPECGSVFACDLPEREGAQR